MVNEITCAEAQKRLADKSATFIDIRDPASFEEAHIPGAIHVDQSNVETFLSSTDKEKMVICYCYHGNNSRFAAEFLEGHGFKAVLSLSGGFEDWRLTFPVV
jgi:thiosulfate sulfurtransferase